MSNENIAKEIAKEFVKSLENPAVRAPFLTANCQNFVWLQCPPYEGEPVDFFQYGPPIPGASGYIYLLGETWYSNMYEDWVIRIPSIPEEMGTYKLLDHAKEAIEMKMAEKWGPENDDDPPFPWRRCAGESETYVHFLDKKIRAFVYPYLGKWRYFISTEKCGISMNRADAMACADAILWSDLWPDKVTEEAKKANE